MLRPHLRVLARGRVSAVPGDLRFDGRGHESVIGSAPHRRTQRVTVGFEGHSAVTRANRPQATLCNRDVGTKQSTTSRSNSCIMKVVTPNRRWSSRDDSSALIAPWANLPRPPRSLAAHWSARSPSSRFRRAPPAPRTAGWSGCSTTPVERDRTTRCFAPTPPNSGQLSDVVDAVPAAQQLLHDPGLA